MIRGKKSGWPVVVGILIVGLHCNHPKTDNATGQSEALSKNTEAGAAGTATAWAAPSASAAAPRDPGPAEWYACRKNEDCELVPHGRCCSACNPINFEGNYTAVNTKFKAEYTAHEGCTDTKCPHCPPPQLDYPRTDTNFFALCQENKCAAIDLRFSKYAQCQTEKDCIFRFGLGCCEGCGDHDLVTYNPASTLVRDVCPIKQKCPPVSAECKALRHPQQPPECVLNRCQLSD
jgi:hypothetical protein